MNKLSKIFNELSINEKMNIIEWLHSETGELSDCLFFQLNKTEFERFYEIYKLSPFELLTILACSEVVLDDEFFQFINGEQIDTYDITMVEKVYRTNMGKITSLIERYKEDLETELEINLSTKELSEKFEMLTIDQKLDIINWLICETDELLPCEFHKLSYDEFNEFCEFHDFSQFDVLEGLKDNDFDIMDEYFCFDNGYNKFESYSENEVEMTIDAHMSKIIPLINLYGKRLIEEFDFLR